MNNLQISFGPVIIQPVLTHNTSNMQAGLLHTALNYDKSALTTICGGPWTKRKKLLTS